MKTIYREKPNILSNNLVTEQWYKYNPQQRRSTVADSIDLEYTL